MADPILKPAGAKAAASGLESRTMLCGCAGLSLEQFLQFVAANPHKGFETVLDETGAGQTCTACLLDLEHHYVNAFRDTRSGRSSGRPKTAAKRPATLKRRIYALVDSLSPLVALRFRNVAPVLYGRGVGEWLWISNHSMMFENVVTTPPFHIDMTLRDRTGATIESARRVIEPGQSLHYDLSGPLLAAAPQAAGELQVGWLDLIRSGGRPGYRGTTRPQFEIVAPAGTCAVHTQAATPPTTAGLTLRLRPGEDRTFLTVLNVEPRPMRFRLRLAAGALSEPLVRQVTVAPHGVELVELVLPEGIQAGPLGILADASWTADRTFKVHVLYASRNLDAFSVDHA